jgi:hypothetical protein
VAVTEDGHFLLQDAVAGHRSEPLTDRAAVGPLGDGRPPVLPRRSRFFFWSAGSGMVAWIRRLRR